MGRIDYYDDPDAPRANSMVPSVNVVVTNDAGQVLLIRRTDNGNWSLPGGANRDRRVPKPGRRARDEGRDQDRLRDHRSRRDLTGPKHVILYTSNGECRQEFSIVLTGRATGGKPTPSDESSDVRWTDRADIASYGMDRSMRQRIEHYLSGSTEPHIG